MERHPPLKAATFAPYRRQLEFAARSYGLPLATFTLEAGRKYLANRIRDDATVFGRYADTKALNLLAEHVLGVERAFRKPRLPRAVPKYLDHDQLRRVMEYRHPVPYESLWVRAFLQLEFTIGARLSEVARLDLADLDPVRSRVHVRHPAKGGRVRWLAVPRSTWSPKRPLMAYLQRRPTPVGDPEALWVGRFFRGCLTEPFRVPQAELARALRDAGTTTGVKLNCTIARHTVGFRLRRAGWDLLAIKDYLGHQSVKSTEVYANDPEDMARQMERRPPRDFFQESDEP